MFKVGQYYFSVRKLLQHLNAATRVFLKHTMRKSGKFNETNVHFAKGIIIRPLYELVTSFASENILKILAFILYIEEGWLFSD